ncbi:MAG: hypothetical protein NTX28_07845 [Novosphingobium sp.]|nr:hypothetical protein [Novosphingobium sp.]
MENAIKEFNAKVQAVTGKAARESDIARFIDQAETAIAHRQARLVQIGFADFRTLSGRAALVEVAF